MVKQISYIARHEWRTWLFLALASFFAASLFMSGYPVGLLPETKVPYTYTGDGMVYLWNVQRAIEGAWYFENVRSGFPFVSNHLDYPTSDTGSYLVIKLLGWLVTTPVAVMNLYYLLGYSACSVAAYLVSRSFGLSKPMSLATALIYSFSAFHFWRAGHLFFTWYFVAPLFFYFGFRLFANQPLFLDSGSIFTRTKLLTIVGLLVLSSFGIYYSLFGCIVLILCAVMAGAFHRSWIHLREGIVIISIVVCGVLLNVMPSLIYISTQGENREGVNRLAVETELYALKLTQMLLPRADHRLDSFFEFATGYNNTFPVTENISSSLGLVGAFGLFILLTALLFSTLPKIVTHTPSAAETESFFLRVQILSVLAISLLLIGTVGGISSLFAMTVSTSIRSWNRISIFIAFIAVLALTYSVDAILKKYLSDSKAHIAAIVLSILLIGIGLYDQTAKPCSQCLKSKAEMFENDANFVRSIESLLPPKGAVYQLPYVAYPENPPINSIGSYDQARGLLHSKDLRWSFGLMRGRSEDWFFRKLSLLPINQQITVAKAIGFKGIYIDRRGYVISSNDKRCENFANIKTDRIKNDCLSVDEVELDIAKELGEQAFAQKIVSKDAQLVFIPFQSFGSKLQTDPETITTIANEYLKPIGYIVQNGVPKQTSGGFDGTLDLRKSNLEFPHYIGSVTGLSGISIDNGESIGRFSDALIAKKVTAWLSRPLPEKFTLQIIVQAAGLNAGKPMKVKVGKQVKEIILSDKFETHSIDFEIDKPIYKIEFTPADPFSPARRWGAADTRLIAVQFQQLSIKSRN